MPPAAPTSADQFFTLAKFLVNVIVIQLLGYVLKTIGAITPVTEAGIGHYVGTIAFPCVLFQALATIDAQGERGATRRRWAGVGPVGPVARPPPPAACSARAHTHVAREPRGRLAVQRRATSR